MARLDFRYGSSYSTPPVVSVDVSFAPKGDLRPGSDQYGCGFALSPRFYRSPGSVKNFSPYAKRLGLRKKPSSTAPFGATASC